MSEQNAMGRAGGSNTEPEESDSEPGGFALSVDLSACVGAPACCRVWVRRRARKLQWLANRVRRAAKLKGKLLLLAGDHLLPPGEPLRVLQRNDTVRVTRVEHEWQDAFSFEDSDEDTPIPPIATTVQKSPKTKRIINKKESTHTNEPTLTQPRSPFKRKFTVGETLRMLNQDVQRTQEHVPETQRHTFIDSPQSSELKQMNEVEYSTQNAECSLVESPVDYEALNRVKRRALALLEQVAERDDTDVVDAPKKKRRRVRRRRPANKLCPEELAQETIEGIALNGSKQTVNSNVTDQGNLESDTDETPNDNPHQESNIQNGSEDLVLPAPTPVKPILRTPTSTMLVAQPVKWSTETLESQEPVVFRNPTPPRAPRVVRAVGSETPRNDVLVG